MPDGRRPPLGMITLACWPVGPPPPSCWPGCFIEGLALLLMLPPPCWTWLPCWCWCCWCWWPWKSFVLWAGKAPVVDSEISALSWKRANFTHNLDFQPPSKLTLGWAVHLFVKWCNFATLSLFWPKSAIFAEDGVKMPSRCTHCQHWYSSFGSYFCSKFKCEILQAVASV